MRKINMSRICIALIIISMMTLCLTGCGDSGETDQIRNTADGLMSALQSWEVDKISEYVKEDMLATDGDLEFVGVIDGLSADFMDSLGVAEEDLSDEAMAAINDFRDTLSAQLIESYDLGEITAEDGKGIVECSITFGYDRNSLFDVGESLDVQTLTTDYAQEHIAELTDIYNSQGEEALQKELMNGVVPIIMTSMKDFVLSSGEKREDFHLIAENLEGKWMITALEADE